MPHDLASIHSLQKRYGTKCQIALRDDYLIECTLADAGIDQFPIELLTCAKLRVLELPDNLIQELPAGIRGMRFLRKLSLARNRIRQIPSEISKLRSLQELNLRANEITSVPAEIGSMTLLTDVDLRENKITDLPVELSKLTAPVVLSLEGNPLVDPLPELLQRGTDSLLTFLGSLSDGVPQYEAKLLLVGEGNVGKSSTVAALRGEMYLPSRSTTHGIELGQLVVPHPDQDNKIVLHTWDFGGQPVYRITHQFFYSKRALYLVVWRPREGAEDNFVEYWLDRIRLRLPEAEARILIVATHADERLVDIDEPRIKARYPKTVRGFLAVDNKTNNGVPKLLDTIVAEAKELPQMGRPINPRWNAVRDELLSMPERFFVHRHEFDEICLKHDVGTVEGKTLLNLLHDLGRLIHYSDDVGLSDIIVLNPEWLTKAIGFVIEDQITMENAGVLSHERLRSIWSDHERRNEPTYETHLHPYFLRLMEKFDISYRIRDSDASLVGQMVPYRRPDLPRMNIGNRKLSLVYLMDDEPPGLVPWLIVRHHRFSVGSHWRRGVYLEHRTHSALIEQDIDGRRLELTVQGAAPDYLFHVIVDGIEHLIQQRWAGLAYSRVVPCPNIVDGVKCSGRFKLETLQRARERGLQTRSCDECFSDISVPQLLTGFAHTGEPISKQLESLHAKLDRVERKVDPISQVLQLQRTVLNAISSENGECPRLFSLWPKDPPKSWRRKFDPQKLGYIEYELWLWCDHPECPHPVAKYEFKAPKEWVRNLAPYASLVAKTLKVGIPIFGAAMDLLVDDALMEVVGPNIDLMEAMSDAFLADELNTGTERALETGLTVAQGSALRELYTFLLEKDASRRWGGLQRKLNVSTGDWQWICDAHYEEYDPGLPDLPT